MARAPSGDTATALTGPPCPRSWACAPETANATNSRPASNRRQRTNIGDGLARNRAPVRIESGIGKAHAERLDAFARARLGERGEESLHRRAGAAARHHEKIIVLGRERQEAEAVDARDRLDRNPP